MTQRCTLLGAMVAVHLLAACSRDARPTPLVEAGPDPEVSTPPGASSQAVLPPAVQVVSLPDATPGIGFDDLRYVAFPSFEAVLVPAGRSGNVNFIDPFSGQVRAMGGFSADAQPTRGHGVGATSADGGFDGLLVVDRTTRKLYLADPEKGKVVGSAELGGAPDYVRYFVPFRQACVTEPDAEQIEVFDMPKVGSLDAAFVAGGSPVRSAVIPVKGGPESLVFDIGPGRAYANLWQGATVVIDVADNKLIATWKNGCEGSRGLVQEGNLVMIGCAEGKISVLDTASGALLGTLDGLGGDVDLIAFAPALRHLYVPSGKAATMAVVGVSPSGQLSLLGALPAAEGAHCVVADNAGYAYVCDPARGAILKIRDPYPATH